MRNRWLITWGFLIASVSASPADDRVGVRQVANKDVAGSRVSCLPQKMHRGCRGSPDSAVVTQAMRAASARPSASAASVAQLFGRPIRSPKRRRDGEAVPILDREPCPAWLAPHYECRPVGSGQDLFVRALIESPSAATAEPLEALQIPAFRDVPPIVIISPDRVPHIGRPTPGGRPDLVFDGSLPLR